MEAAHNPILEAAYAEGWAGVTAHTALGKAFIKWFEKQADTRPDLNDISAAAKKAMNKEWLQSQFDEYEDRLPMTRCHRQNKKPSTIEVSSFGS